MDRQEEKVAGISKEAYSIIPWKVQRTRDTNSHQLSFGLGSIQAFVVMGEKKLLFLHFVWFLLSQEKKNMSLEYP